MSDTRIISDGLVTAVDVQNFKAEINLGCFKARLLEMIAQEPQLAEFISERQSKVMQSLIELGMDGRRLAALHRHVNLMVFGSLVLLSRAHRRQWEGFLPLEETEDERG